MGAGLVPVPARATVADDDAQAYLDILDTCAYDDSYLIDFDADGRAELVTVFLSDDGITENYSVWQGKTALIKDGKVTLVGSEEGPNVYTRGGKTYIGSSGGGEYLFIQSFETVENGKWVNRSISGEYDWEKEEDHYDINGKEVDEAKYLEERDAYKRQYSMCSYYNDYKAGDVKAQLEKLAADNAAKSMTVEEADARAYLDILDTYAYDNSYLIDFDADGREELLTMRWDSDTDGVYSVWQGKTALTKEARMSGAMMPECAIYTKNGKNYVRDSNSTAFGAFYDFYTVKNGAWVKSVRYEDQWYDEDPEGTWTIDKKEVSQETYEKELKAYKFQFSIHAWNQPKTGDVKPQLEKLVAQAEANAQAAALAGLSPREILAKIPYYGDVSKCAMATDQALAFAATLEKEIQAIEESDREYRAEYDPEWRTEVEAALCDVEGNGIPALLIFDCPVMNVYSYEEVNVYTWKDATVQEPECFSASGSTTGHYFFGESADGGFLWNRGSGLTRDEGYYKVRNGEFVQIAQYIIDWGSDDLYTVYIADEKRGGFPAYDKNIKLGSFEDESDAFAAAEEAMPQFKEGAKIYYSYDEERGDPTEVLTLLRAYAQARRFPDYTYAVLDAAESVYAQVLAAAKVSQAAEVRQLTDGLYYVLYEEQGTYRGALVRQVREKGRPVFRLERTDREPVEQTDLEPLVAQAMTQSNLVLDFKQIGSGATLDGLRTYLQGLLEDMDAPAPNDPAKGELAAFLDSAVSALSTGSLTGKKGRLAPTRDEIAALAEQAKAARDGLAEVLEDNGVDLNKTVVPVVRGIWEDVDLDEPCAIALTEDVARALDGCDLQILLGSAKTYFRFTADDLEELTGEFSGLQIRFSQEGDGVYAIHFLDGEGELVDELMCPVTVSLPAAGPLDTIMATYGGEVDNWGGQFDAATGAISFEARYSGTYEVLENDVDIRDIDALSEESRAAIAFMVSKGYLKAEDGLFCPGDPLTRYEFTQALVGMFFALDRGAECDFPDMDAGSPYYPYVASAQAKGIVNGYSDGTFSGEDTITREQVFALAARTLMDQKGYAQPREPERYLSSFGDRAELSDWAAEQVALAVREGIATRGAVLAPQADITREQAAVVLYRLFQLLYEVPVTALDLPEENGSDGMPVGAVVAFCVGGAALVGGAVAAGVAVTRRKRKEDPAEAEK